MILTVKCKFDQCTSETTVETDDVDIGAYLSELDHEGWIFPDGTDIAYSISDAELEGYCPFAHGAVRKTKGGNHVIKILPVFLAAVLFLGGCASNPLQVLSESLTIEDKVEIIDSVRKHGYARVQETSWTNFQTGNRYTMYPRWRNDTHHVFALHAVVSGKSTTGGKLIQGYGHVFQSSQGLWTVSEQFSDIQMLNGPVFHGKSKKRVRHNRFYFSYTK
jgi:hypothetical protein